MNREGNQFEDIRLSATAKSKCYRMFKTHRIRTKLQQLNGVLYQKGESNEYHLLTEPTIDEPDWEGKDWVIAFAVKDDHILVITQMHEHFDYDNETVYRRVGSPYAHQTPTSSRPVTATVH